MTQAELSKAACVSIVQVSKWENSRSICTIHTLQRLCKIFNREFVLDQYTDLNNYNNLGQQ